MQTRSSRMARCLFWCRPIAVLLCLTFPKVSLAQWDVIHTPPTLVNPTTLFLPNDATLENWPEQGGSCAGQYHDLSLNNSQDYIIRMLPGAPALTRPVGVFGGRNVRIVGLSIDITTQSGCGVGLFSQPGTPGGVNIHPYMTLGGKALYLQQTHVSFVEGAHIKMNGHEGDCAIGRNPSGVVGATAFAQRDYVIQNTRCEGIEGVPNSIHGDSFQQQGAPGGGEVTRNLIFENHTVLSSYEGAIHEPNDNNFSYGVKKFVARRFNYVWDPVYGVDDSLDDDTALSGPAVNIAVEGAFEDSLVNLTITDFWIKPFNEYDFR